MRRSLVLGVSMLSLSLVTACGAQSSPTTSATTPTQSPSPTATPSPTAIAQVTATATNDLCPQTTSGAQVTLTEPSMLLSFTYPASVAETHCKLTSVSNGGWLLWVGNLLEVYAEPTAGRTIQQYVNAKKTSYETVTLTSVTLRQAQEAYLVKDTLAANASGPGYFTEANVVALLRGSQYIYEVRGLQVPHFPVGPADMFASKPLSDYVPGFAVS